MKKSTTMNKVFFILWLVLSGTLATAQDMFKITGRLGGSLSGNLMLVINGPQGAVKLADAMMIDGNFEFTGKVDAMTPAYILTDQQQPIATLMLENTEYALLAGQNGIEVEGGGEAQKILNRYNAVNQMIMREKMKMELEAKQAYAQQNQMKLQALQQQFQKVMEEAGKQQAALFETYKDSPVTAFVIASGMQQMDYTSLKTVYDNLGENAKNCLHGQVIARQIKQFKRVEVGAVPVDFMGLTAEGDTVSLYGVQAKLKLVDFWASWCAPCRAELPNVKKIYKKYRELGLEIIGVSIDQKPADWMKALEEEKLPWPNIIDPEGKIANHYFVRAIPYTLLLDENNKIIAKNLRGKELEKKIAELLPQ